MTDQDARSYRVLWTAVQTPMETSAQRFHLELEIEVALALGRISLAQAQELRTACRSAV